MSTSKAIRADAISKPCRRFGVPRLASATSVWQRPEATRCILCRTTICSTGDRTRRRCAYAKARSCRITFGVTHRDRTREIKGWRGFARDVQVTPAHDYSKSQPLPVGIFLPIPPVLARFRALASHRAAPFGRPGIKSAEPLRASLIRRCSIACHPGKCALMRALNTRPWVDSRRCNNSCTIT